MKFIHTTLNRFQYFSTVFAETVLYNSKVIFNPRKRKQSTEEVKLRIKTVSQLGH